MFVTTTGATMADSRSAPRKSPESASRKSPECALAWAVLARVVNDALARSDEGREGFNRDEAREFCLVPRMPELYENPDGDPAFWRALWCDAAGLDEAKFVEGMRRKIHRCLSRETQAA